MKSLSISLFLQNLQGITESNEQQTNRRCTVPVNQINEYLLFHLVRPSVMDEDVCFGDLDYSAFALDDLDPCGDLLESITDSNLTGLTLWFTLKAQKPEAIQSRAYC